jgi:hypothetical protein
MPQKLQNPTVGQPYYCEWTGASVNLTDNLGTDIPAELPIGLITKDTTALFVAVTTEAAAPTGGRRADPDDAAGDYLTRRATVLNQVIFDVRGPAQVEGARWYLCCQDLTAGGVMTLYALQPINDRGGRPDA